MGLKKPLTLMWTDVAKRAAKEIYMKYLREDDPKWGFRTRRRLLKLVVSLTEETEINSNPKFFLTEDGQIRYVYFFTLRIVYEVSSKEILIIDIYNSKRTPLEIKKSSREY